MTTCSLAQAGAQVSSLSKPTCPDLICSERAALTGGLVHACSMTCTCSGVYMRRGSLRRAPCIAFQLVMSDTINSSAGNAVHGAPCSEVPRSAGALRRDWTLFHGVERVNYHRLSYTIEALLVMKSAMITFLQEVLLQSYALTTVCL